MDRDAPKNGPEAKPEAARPVVSALRALASCVEFLLTGGRRDQRRERQKLNEAQRLIADLETRVAADGHEPAGEPLPAPLSPPPPAPPPVPPPPSARAMGTGTPSETRSRPAPPARGPRPPSRAFPDDEVWA